MTETNGEHHAGLSMMSGMIAAEEIVRRNSRSIASSRFNPDTELEHNDFLQIATILSARGYSLEQLKRINYEEVAPVVSFNLMSVGGVWNGFHEDWLENEILKKAKKQ